MKKILLCLISILISQISVNASNSKSHIFYEREYQNYWCKINGGITEYVLPDKSRVDCVTDTHAIEFDFAPKWAESIGQSLYYGKMLNKKPKIVLIIENASKDQKYIKRVKMIAEQYDIDLSFISPHDLLYSKFF